MLTKIIVHIRLYNWTIIFVGPKDSPYNTGLFIAKIIFPENYPNSAPDIIFLTPIYHLNVNPYKSEKNGDEKLGYINLAIIKKWKPKTKLRQIINQLFSLFYFPNPDLAYEMDIAMEYKFKRALYEEKAKYFTKKYADINNDINFINDKSWNFLYDDSKFIPDENKKINEIENESYKYDSNDNEKIILIFENNGINKISLECQMNELTRDVIQRCLDKLGISKNIDSSEILFIYNIGKLNLNISVRCNNIINNSAIAIIYDYAA